jgi:hypothetical protein
LMRLSIVSYLQVSLSDKLEAVDTDSFLFPRPW